MEGGNYEMGDGMQQCIDHSHRNNNPGAICAFCLQDKLGKLLSSSTSSFPSPSSSSPSFTPPSSSDHNTHSRLPFLVPNKKPSSDNIIFKRSKSTATPRKRNGFWSFLYPSSSSSSKEAKSFGPNGKPRDKCVAKQSDHVIIITEEDKCCFSSSKVSRSRSVGCGSRSFSADFFERISSGLGDCTLRRVESQRASASASVNHCMKERVRCGGIFGSFVMTSSSSSTASSWLDDGSRGRSWGWAFASPMRAFTNNKASSSSKRDASDHKNATPNLSAIPSLLTVRG